MKSSFMFRLQGGYLWKICKKLISYSLQTDHVVHPGQAASSEEENVSGGVVVEFLFEGCRPSRQSSIPLHT